MSVPRSADLAPRLEDIGSSIQKRRHVLDLDDFVSEEISMVLDTAQAMKEVLQRRIKKVPTLRGKTIVTLFYEPSTRTRVSFEMAGKVLNADVINLAPSVSSVTKGESLLNTVRTIQAAYADVIVVRHKSAGAPYHMAKNLEASVINAGDGFHAHPTQALLDLYTIRERLGEISGLKITIIGDVTHSRVARSNIWGLTTMGASVTLCGPSTLLPIDMLNGQLRDTSGPFAKVHVTENIDEAVSGADVIMVLRLQQERQQTGLLPSLREYAVHYQVNDERLKLASPHSLVLHPGPMNEGVEISSSVAHGTQSVIEEQVTNGVAIRMALLYLLAQEGKEL
jgi:aspartate carbamoyltransferase catalytic subunit